MVFSQQAIRQIIHILNRYIKVLDRYYIVFSIHVGNEEEDSNLLEVPGRIHDRRRSSTELGTIYQKMYFIV